MGIVLLFGMSFVIPPEHAFAEIKTDKSVYSKGELIRITGTIDFQDDDEIVNIVEIEITNFDTDNTVINVYTPLDDDNSFSSSYDSATWPTGDYQVKISYNDVDETAEFEISNSSSSSSSSSNDDGLNNNNGNDNDNSDNTVQQENESTSSSSDIPSNPTNLIADVISSTQIDLSWSAPNDDSSITGYKIEHRTNTDPNYSVTVENTGSTDTTYSHTNLTPDTVYAYRVSAINSVGTSEPSSSTTVKTSGSSTSSINESNINLEDTDIPSNLVAKTISSTSVELRWNPPTQTYGQTIQDYTIKQEIVSDVYDEITSTSSTKYTLSGLDPGQTYTFVVVANYALGSSDVSDEVTVTLTSTLDEENSTTESQDNTNNESQNNTDDNSSIIPDDIPNSPTELRVKPISSTQIDLSWSAPNNDNINNDSITGYKIEVRTISNTTYSTAIVNTESTDTTYSHTGLIPETTYIYRVSAINAAGISEPSSENLANTLPSDPEDDKKEDANVQHDSNAQNDPNFDESDLESSSVVPSTPTGLTATAISQSRIDLSWSAPVDNGASALLGYKIESKTNNESDYSVLVTNTGTVTTVYSHTGLTAGMTYQYRIFAINSSGQSDPSDITEATIILSNEQQFTPQSPSIPEPVSVTLNTNKNVYDSDDSIEVYGTVIGSTQNMPIGMRIISSNDAIVYVRSISADDNTFEILIPPTQRQSSVWQSNGEFTIEMTHNGRLEATTTFEIYNENANVAVTESTLNTQPETESNEQQSQSPTASPQSSNDDTPLTVTPSNNKFNTSNDQNLTLQSANQQLRDENTQLKTQIEELNKRIEQLDAIVKEQIKVMMETLSALKSSG
ncbi:MAG: fibronectin type III domain-containing protein [Nitrosopumilus sp.]|nr:fibronectin type III domain-containing protein [Nitrosopumilus sp.]